MDLSIIVVNFNTRKLLEDCLQSIERYLEGALEYEVVVIDNASTDGSPEWLKVYAEGRNRVKIELSPENTGFSGGNNLGFSRATGRNVLMLNSDAYLIDSSLLAAVNYLDSRSDVFSLGCMLLDGRGQPGPSYGYFPTAITVARELLGKGYTKLRAVSPGLDEPTHEIDFPCGAYYLIKGSLLKKAGMLDQAFFMYFEETDLAKRAVSMGYKNIYFASAKAVHLGGQSTQEVKSMFLTRMFYQNWSRYLHKHHGPLQSLLVRSMVAAYLKAASIRHGWKGNHTAAEFFLAHGQALAEGWRSRAA